MIIFILKNFQPSFLGEKGEEILLKNRTNKEVLKDKVIRKSLIMLMRIEKEKNANENGKEIRGKNHIKMVDVWEVVGAKWKIWKEVQHLNLTPEVANLERLTCVHWTWLWLSWTVNESREWEWHPALPHATPFTPLPPAFNFGKGIHLPLGKRRKTSNDTA